MVDKQSVRTHQEPAWRSKANYAALVKLEDFEAGNAIMYEQLALRKLESGLYTLCCIPFHIYDVNLGDLVRVENKVINRIKDEGHYGFRAYNNLERADFSVYSLISDQIVAVGAQIEYTEDGRLWAIDIDNEAAASKLSGMLQQLVKDGRFTEYETARTK